MDKINHWTTQEEVKIHAKYVCEYIQTVNRVWEQAKILLKEKWDGKMLNKRFCTQLEEKFKNELDTCNII